MSHAENEEQWIFGACYVKARWESDPTAILDARYTLIEQEEERKRKAPEREARRKFKK